MKAKAKQGHRLEKKGSNDHFSTHDCSGDHHPPLSMLKGQPLRQLSTSSGFQTKSSLPGRLAEALKPGPKALMTHEKAQNNWAEENLLVKRHFLTPVLKDTRTPSRVCREVQGTRLWDHLGSTLLWCGFCVAWTWSPASRSVCEVCCPHPNSKSQSGRRLWRELNLRHMKTHIKTWLFSWNQPPVHLFLWLEW